MHIASHFIHHCHIVLLLQMLSDALQAGARLLYLLGIDSAQFGKIGSRFGF